MRSPRLFAIRPDAKLVIAGGASLLDHGEYQRKFRSRLAAMGEAAGSVRLLGIIADSDMPRLYRLASALAFVSVKEGFGLCVLEAMASGVPVVVSAIEPFTSYLSAKNSIWCDPLSVGSIAEAMALALDEKFAAPLRGRGRALAARFDWRAVARAHEPVYQRMTGSSRMPEMRFIVRWPDGAKDTCYSPSLVIKDYFREGETYALGDFVARSREALMIASDRVKAKYGHACSRALGQLAEIERAARRFADEPGAKVACERFLF